MADADAEELVEIVGGGKNVCGRRVPPAPCGVMGLLTVLSEPAPLMLVRAPLPILVSRKLLLGMSVSSREVDDADAEPRAVSGPALALLINDCTRGVPSSCVAVAALLFRRSVSRLEPTRALSRDSTSSSHFKLLPLVGRSARSARSRHCLVR